MESDLSCLSSLKEDDNPVYVQPHYKESYRLAIYALLCGGKEAYEEFLRAEQISHFLSEEEILFILENGESPVLEDDPDERRITDEASSSTYFPTESDEEVPDLDLGWPEVSLEGADTSISLLFHPPRDSTPTIKEVVRKQIQEARQVIAIAMDVFTDVDIFKEVISATLRGVAVYILLDESHFKSFLTMSRRVGVNVRDFKNIRVRTVQGLQYHCQSGVKFHGGLEQKFIVVDCRTVLHGTYSYTWTFEKINLSMVLVITGQLVCSYDEEFRRLYARSTVPAVQSSESYIKYLRDPVTLQSPNSSQLSLHQIHMRSRVMHGMRSAQDDRFNSATMMTRGLSVQERLHQSHCPDMGNLVRGHSYGGELQMLNSMTRMRMGTKDVGVPLTPERTGSKLRGGDMLLTNRLSQQHLRHRARYGADQNLIPFNSETSLHRWKMDAYFNDNNALDASYDALSPMASPYSSNTGLNEHQSQLIHSRSRDIKSRMEEMRQKRLSLQEYANLRQSQESLRSMYATLERPKLMSSLRGLDMRQSGAELEPITQNGYSQEPSKHKDSEPLSKTTSAADLDMKLNDPSLKLSHLQPSSVNIQQLSRTMESLTEIPEEKEGSNTHVNSSDSVAFTDGNDGKDEKALPKENSVKSSLPAEPQHQDQAGRSHGSIAKVANSSDSAAPKEGKTLANQPDSAAPKEGKTLANRPDSDAPKEGKTLANRPDSDAPKEGKTLANSVDPASPKERKKSISNEVQTVPKVLNSSAGSQHAVETKSSHTEKAQTQPTKTPTPTLQRKNSMRMKVYSLLTSDDKKTSKKEERSLQRKASLRSQNPLRSDHSRASAAEQSTKKGNSPSISRSQKSSPGSPASAAELTTKKGHSPSISRSQKTSPGSPASAAELTTKKGHSPSISRSQKTSPGSPAETEKHKSPFLRLSPQRSSKRKMNPAAEQSGGSRSTPNNEGAMVYERGKVYSRFEYLLSTESIPRDKSMRVASMYPSEKDRGASLNRHDSGNQMYQTQSGSDNKLGRFMQRVGNLIGKNK